LQKGRAVQFDEFAGSGQSTCWCITDDEFASLYGDNRGALVADQMDARDTMVAKIEPYLEFAEGEQSGHSDTSGHQNSAAIAQSQASTRRVSRAGDLCGKTAGLLSMGIENSTGERVEAGANDIARRT
jgi:hypothetical protein